MMQNDNDTSCSLSKSLEQFCCELIQIYGVDLKMGAGIYTDGSQGQALTSIPGCMRYFNNGIQFALFSIRRMDEELSQKS